MGKAYANRKTVEERRLNDFYETPKSLIWELLKTDVLKDSKKILEPCCGNYVISDELIKAGFDVTSKDLIYGNNFLLDEYKFGEYDTIVTNPAFSQFDKLVTKAKEVSPLVVMIGKTNFLGAQSRLESGLWEGLSDLYVFSRQIDYQFPVMRDGSMGVGNLITGFYVWRKGYTDSPRLHFIDVQKYCTLGSYENWLKKNDLVKYQEYLDKKTINRR